MEIINASTIGAAAKKVTPARKLTKVTRKKSDEYPKDTKSHLKDAPKSNLIRVARLRSELIKDREPVKILRTEHVDPGVLISNNSQMTVTPAKFYKNLKDKIIKERIAKLRETLLQAGLDKQSQTDFLRGKKQIEELMNDYLQQNQQMLLENKSNLERIAHQQQEKIEHKSNLDEQNQIKRKNNLDKIVQQVKNNAPEVVNYNTMSDIFLNDTPEPHTTNIKTLNAFHSIKDRFEKAKEVTHKDFNRFVTEHESVEDFKNYLTEINKGLQSYKDKFNHSATAKRALYNTKELKESFNANEKYIRDLALLTEPVYRKALEQHYNIVYTISTHERPDKPEGEPLTQVYEPKIEVVEFAKQTKSYPQDTPVVNNLATPKVSSEVRKANALEENRIVEPEKSSKAYVEDDSEENAKIDAKIESLIDNSGRNLSQADKDTERKKAFEVKDSQKGEGGSSGHYFKAKKEKKNLDTIVSLTSELSLVDAAIKKINTMLNNGALLVKERKDLMQLLKKNQQIKKSISSRLHYAETHERHINVL